MSDTLTALAHPAGLRLGARAIPLAIGLGGVALQSLAVLNHDVAWVLHSSAWLIDGGVFGREIVAANPPLIWWVSALPMAAARLTGLSPALMFHVFLALILAGALAGCERLLRGSLDVRRRCLFLSAAALLLAFGAARNFGQREHLTAIVALPYLVLASARLKGEACGTWLALAIGSAAAVGFAFKPHLLAVPALIEGLLLWRLGWRQSLSRPELMAAAATVVGYVTAVLFFAWPYLSEALPKIASVYWAFNTPDTLSLISNSTTALVLLALALLMLRAASGPALAAVSTLAAAGFLLAAAAQWKAYSYHLYPVLVYAALALVLMGFAPSLRRYLAVGVVFYLSLLAYASWQDRLPSGATGRNRMEMVDFVNAQVGPGGRFLAFSTHPFPGFPTALYAHAGWASLSNSRIFLPAVVRLKARGEEGDALAAAMASEWAAALRDLSKLPELVLVDVAPLRHAILDLPFDYLAFYNEDAAFADLWRHYREIPGAPDGFRAFVLNREGAT